MRSEHSARRSRGILESAEAQRKLAEALRENGEVDAAIAAFQAAIRLEPDDGLTHKNLGLALQRKGDLDGAIAEFRAATAAQAR